MSASSAVSAPDRSAVALELRLVGVSRAALRRALASFTSVAGIAGLSCIQRRPWSRRPTGEIGVNPETWQIHLPEQRGSQRGVDAARDESTAGVVPRSQVRPVAGGIV